MTETKIKNRCRKLATPVVILVVLAAAIFLSIAYSRKITKQLYTERSQAMITVTQKSAEGLDTLLQNAWVSLGSAEKLLQYDRSEHPELYEDADQLGDRAVWLQDLLQLNRNTKFSGMVIILDSNLRAYTGDGHISRWEDISYLVSDHDTCITRLSYQSADSNSIFILHKLDNAISIGDTQISHIIINIPVSTFADVFRVADYRDQNFTYVVGRGGERMCRYQQ